MTGFFTALSEKSAGNLAEFLSQKIKEIPMILHSKSLLSAIFFKFVCLYGESINWKNMKS